MPCTLCLYVLCKLRVKLLQKFLHDSLPSPSSHCFLSNGRVGIPNDPAELRIALLQDDPTETQACPAEAGIHSEEDDQAEPHPA